MRTRTWAALAAAALTVTACSVSPVEQRPEDTVVIALGGEPDTLNPILSYDIYHEDTFPIFNGLLRYSKDTSQVPDLASELPTVSPDGKSVTVRLRPDVTFHDGAPLTAHDVVFTYNSILDPGVASAFRSQLDAVESVEALDRDTVRFSLNRIDPAFLDKLHVGIVPQHLLAGQDLSTAAFNAAPVGTGPYVFLEWRKGERVMVEANPAYFRGPPRIRRVVYLFVPDENARAVVTENGAADVADVAPRLAERFRRNDELRVIEVPSADTHFLILGNGDPVLRDPAVRRAFSFAVDRRQIADGVLGGAGEPAYGPIPRGHWAHDPDQIRYEPDRARQILDDLGWRDGNGDRVRERNGTRLAVTLMYYAENSVAKDVALAVRQDLAEVGVDVAVEGLGFDAIEPRVDREATVWAGGSPYDPDFVVYRLFHSRFATDDDPFTNEAKMANPEVDAALEAGRSTLDQAQRTRSYRDLQQALLEDGSYLYLVQLTHLFAVSNRITGIDPMLIEGHGKGPAPAILWNIEDWELTGGRP